MDRVSSFFVGNVVGITILVAGVLITAPKKIKETEAIQKQEQLRKEQAAQEGALKSSADESTKNDSADSKAMAPVVVASEEITKGEQIAKNQLVLKNSSDKVDSDSIRDITKVVGKTAKIDVHKGSAITTEAIDDSPSR